MTNPIWHCPDHPASPVSRSGDRSRCDACGQTNHPLDLPGVDRVLVIGSQIRVFQDWAMSHRPDATTQTTARYGITVYCYRSSIEQIPGFNRETTRYYSLGPFSDRTLRADDYAQELYAPAFPAPPESRQAPEPDAGGRVIAVDEAVEAIRAIAMEMFWDDCGHPTIGNPACRFNARSRFLRCAVRPDGPCEGCSDFELRGEGDE